MIRTLSLLLSLLNRDDRRTLVFIFLLVLATALGEVVGVSSITPFIAVLARPSIIHENAYLRRLYDLGDFSGTQSFLAALGGLFLCLLLSSLALRGIGLWAQLRYANNRSEVWSSRLLNAYLRQDYEWFLNRHSSQLGSTILNEVDNVVWNGLVPAIQVFAQGTVVTALLLMLVVVDPALALGAGLFMGLGYGLLSLIIKNRLRQLGAERMSADRRRFHIVDEAFGGIKEVKVLSLEERMLAKYRVPARIRAARVTSASVLAQVPSLAMQGLIFGGMLLALLYLVSSRGSFESALPTISLYAFAGYRLMPAMQRTFEESAKCRTAEPMIAALVQTLSELERTTSTLDVGPRSGKQRTPIVPATQIALKDVVYAYPGSDRHALHGLSIRVPVNTSIGIVGASGSGKSTFVDILLGLISPAAGQLEVDSRPLTPDELSTWRRSVGYIPQQIFLSDDSIAANIAFGEDEDQVDRQAVERAAKTAHLHEFIVSELPHGYDTQVGERGVKLSGGQRQRIGIARALYHNPSVLVMDEATSALDNLTEQIVMDEIRQLGKSKTLVIVAHRLTTVRHCDQIFVLEHGRVTDSGTFVELQQRSEYFAKLTA